jgi:cardiolipin synthase
LLEAGIRVFEWNGSMLHAKTAVADGSWVRIGSSNLNLASWLGNWELDVAIEDADLADQMEEMFLEDQAQATEMVLDLGKVRGAEAPWRETRRKRRGSPGRAAAGALSIGSAVGAAITNRRTLGPAEARILAAAGAIVTVLAVVAILAPHVLTIPFSLIGLWIAVTLFVRAWQLRRRRP